MHCIILGYFVLTNTVSFVSLLVIILINYLTLIQIVFYLLLRNKLLQVTKIFVTLLLGCHDNSIQCIRFLK